MYNNDEASRDAGFGAIRKPLSESVRIASKLYKGAFAPHYASVFDGRGAVGICNSGATHKIQWGRLAAIFLSPRPFIYKRSYLFYEKALNIANMFS